LLDIVLVSGMLKDISLVQIELNERDSAVGGSKLKF
jgi:hypothetical protein